MKITRLAIAIAGLVCCSAFAQGNVTVYGGIDLSIETGNYGRGNVTRLADNGYKAERLGFQGSEDLGDGMKVNFRLEMGPGTDNGSNDSLVGQFFQREAWLSLSGSLGTLVAGRQYTPVFLVQNAGDQFRTGGVGSNYSLTNTGMTRASNALRWRTLAINGLTVVFMYSLGDTGAPSAGGAPATGGTLQESAVDPKDAGRHTGLSLRYSDGPLVLGYGYGSEKTKVFAPAIPSTNKVNNVIGTYDFQAVQLFASWENAKNSATNAGDFRAWTLGLHIPVGADHIDAAYTSRHLPNAGSSDSRLLALGYAHPLSKRTVLYANWARMNNDSKARASFLYAPVILAADAGYDPSAFQVGVGHDF